MKTAHEIFMDVGLPLYMVGSPVARDGIRGFHEVSIKAIQAEAFKAGLDAAMEVIATKGHQLDEGNGYSPTKLSAACEIGNAISRIKLP